MESPSLRDRMELLENAESQMTIGMTFSESGYHRVEATIEVQDDLAIDNRAVWSVMALGQIPTLILDPTLHDRKRLPQSEFLQAALGRSMMNPTTTPVSLVSRGSKPDKLNDDHFRSASIVVLANVNQLKPARIRQLKEWVGGGGILVIFAGEDVDPDWYNRELGNWETTTAEVQKGSQRFLPYRFSDRPQQVNADDFGMKIRREQFQHPSVRFLNEFEPARWRASKSDRGGVFDPAKETKSTPH